MVNDIKIIQGRDGLFISMPSRKKKNGEFKDVAHPLNNETRRMIEEKVLAEYDRDARGARRGRRRTVASGPGEVPAANTDVEAAAEPGPRGAGEDLEEVEEMHLRDSFWTV